MESSSNVIAPPAIAASRRRRDELRGLVLATLGVAMFSFSLPATRLAVADLDPMFVAFGRAAVAAVLAAIVLRALARAAPAAASSGARCAIVAFGVVVGFPLLTALALRHVDSTHGAVVIALLPACDRGVRRRCGRASALARRSGSPPAPASSPCSRSSRRRASATIGVADLELLARHRAVRARLRRGRRAVAHARRPADDLLGARALARR